MIWHDDRMSSQLTIRSGAGIGGLTFCVALGRQSNAKVDLYEAAHEFGEIGAGIGLSYRTWQTMGTLGVQEDLAALERKVQFEGAREWHLIFAFHTKFKIQISCDAFPQERST